jgi:mycothione reductase
MDTKHYDLIVFGGGNAISTAIQCGAKGMHVALVEQGPLGGTCPHRGCIPSKLLIGYPDAVAMPFISGMPGFCLSRRFH